MSQAQRRTLIAGLLQGSPQAAERAEKLAAITAGMTPAKSVSSSIRRVHCPRTAIRRAR
jgi:hypothetical protein